MTDITDTLRQEYLGLAHAMQSGVAMEMYHRSSPTEPKHLRVGINSAMSDLSGLAQLLIAKGVITETEYFRALRDGMRQEVERYERYLSELVGSTVKLA